MTQELAKVIITAILMIIGIMLYVIRKLNRLALLELLTIWLFVSTLNQNIVDIAISNLKLFKITEQLQMSGSSLLIRFVLIPLLYMVFSELYTRTSRILWKIVLFAASVFVMTAIEYAAKLVGILQFTGWSVWWSLGEWTGIGLALMGCRRLYAYLLGKGAPHYDSP